MTDRDALVAMIVGTVQRGREFNEDDEALVATIAPRAADAILAAGWRAPEDGHRCRWMAVAPGCAAQCLICGELIPPGDA